MTDALKKTPLHDWHIASGANMSNFGGFSMPLWYPAGIKTEHLSVLTSVGLFDTSHMGILTLNGIDAVSFLNLCFTKDLSALQNGKATYGAFLNHKGHCIDDAIIYKFTGTEFMICVNAGMGKTISTHLNELKNNFNVTIHDLSQQIGKIDIQGPDSAKVLSEILHKPEDVFKDMSFFSFKGSLFSSNYAFESVLLQNKNSLLISRSGYTGEFGFELFVDPNSLQSVWESLLKAGEQFDIVPCGLGARDSLRAGACLPLSHQDIGSFLYKNHPWEFALPFNKKKTGFTKEFIGSNALLENKIDTYTLPYVGDTLRKISIGENTKVLDQDNNHIGTVLTCTTDMSLAWHNDEIVNIHTDPLPEDFKIKGLSCGFVYVDKKLKPGTTIELVEGKRKIKATIVKDVRPNRTSKKNIKHLI